MGYIGDLFGIYLTLILFLLGIDVASMFGFTLVLVRCLFGLCVWGSILGSICALIGFMLGWRLCLFWCYWGSVWVRRGF